MSYAASQDADGFKFLDSLQFFLCLHMLGDIFEIHNKPSQFTMRLAIYIGRHNKGNL